MRRKREPYPMKPSLALPVLLLPLAALALEVNTATRAQLEQLNGLGVATVERILQAREQRPFADWQDLTARVSGLRGKRAEQLDRQGLTVGGRSLRGSESRK
jgi:competence protein ComEA